MNRNWLSALLVCVIISAGLPQHSAAREADVPAFVRVVPPRTYAAAVQQALQAAQRSIFVSMPRVQVRSSERTPQVYALVQALIDAGRRGVAVTVLLDKSAAVVGASRQERAVARADKNAWCYRMLKSAGIDVRYDDELSALQARVVIVDDARVIIGSSEWTEASLSGSGEADIAVESTELAAALRAQFAGIGCREPERQSEMSIPAVAVSRKLWEYYDLGARMVQRNDAGVFDLYLILLREAAAARASRLMLDVDAAAEEMGVSEAAGRTQTRARVRQLAALLQDKYWLITVSPRSDNRLQISLLDYDDAALAYEPPTHNFLLLPVTYWEYGWAAQLGLPAKFVYGMCLAAEAMRPGAAWWFVGMPELNERFSVSPPQIQEGVRELQRYGLLEVQYDESGGIAALKRGFLYNLEKVFAVFDHLAQRYGRHKVQAARRCVEPLGKMYDPAAVEEVLQLMETAGEKRVSAAFQAAQGRVGGGPALSYEAVVETIQRIPR
ncbi:MAG: phospholipase D-like domain-containing protein [Candidatus Omnitrophica bacterium]|nr:phospholipase D-like domain-containing protein [Candidatus Omnitrophota bacterium]